MVRLVDENGSPCALHLAVRDAAGEPVVELRADSPLWWGFGVVTVLHRPELRFCGTQFPSIASALPLGTLKSYFSPTPSQTCPVEQLEAYVAPHTVGDLQKELLGTHSTLHPNTGQAPNDF